MRDGEPSTSNGTSKAFSNGSGATPLHKAAMSNSANGSRGSSGVMNGSTNANGHSNSVTKPRPTYFGHDREEVTRILIQALTDLGYNGAAAGLSQESGYDLESPVVAAFRNAVLQGEWNEAEELLFGGSIEEGGVSINGNGLALQDYADKNVMKFWMRQQKFLELLEQRDTGRALMVLRSELTPLYQDTSKLHFLSSLLMCQSSDDLKRKAEWDGAAGTSRHHLLSDLSQCISPSVMLPEHRLGVLLRQVKQTQISRCLYHNSAASPSLYQDHNCDHSNFPVNSFIELGKHSGEVWQVSFSHDGKKLASCGEDGTAIIYDVETFEPLHSLADHQKGIVAVSWSPDDSMIVTCSWDTRARLWNANTGNLIRTLPKFGGSEPVTSCVWAPDGLSFLTGVLSKTESLCQWSTNGDLIHDWKAAHRIQDLTLSPDGHRLVAMDNDTHIFVYNFITRELEYKLDIKGQMGSVSISSDSKHLLINKFNGEARLLDMESRETLRIFNTPDRPKGFNYLIRATLGGANESFVATGGEDGYIYIWHKESGTLIEKIEGHEKGLCNSISWNPTNPQMFASAGDDNKVRIWTTEDPRLKLPKISSRHGNGASGW